MDTMNSTAYSYMVGVFRERTNAEQALDELKQTGFQDTKLTMYNPHPAEEPVETSQVDSGMRVLVHILAEGREQEAVGILVGHGANNSDLPFGTALSHGSIVGSSDAPDVQSATS